MANGYDLPFIDDAEESAESVARADADIRIGVTGGATGLERELDCGHRLLFPDWEGGRKVPQRAYRTQRT
jgi:hypothetical protein